MKISATRQVVIDQPASKIDLVQWLETLTDREYQACSRSHRAAGVFYEGGRLGSINVESIGGHLLIQHYLAEISDPNHMMMRSRKSRAYLLHLMPASIDVIWTMEVQPDTSSRCLFRCTVEANMSTALGIAALGGLLPFFIKRHTHEETALFARDIGRKVQEGAFLAGRKDG